MYCWKEVWGQIFVAYKICWVKNNMSLHCILNMRGNIYFVVFDKGSRLVAHESVENWGGGFNVDG